jgi:hypothetical protein
MNTFRDMDRQTKGIFTEAELVIPESSTICNGVPNQSWKMTRITLKTYFRANRKQNLNMVIIEYCR